MVHEPLSVDSEAFSQSVSALLAEGGFHGRFTLHQLQGGANNRVYRVAGRGFTVLLKVYFQPSGDLRDRLGAEFAFSRFAWGNGLRCLPRPLACDPTHHLGLYEFVEGRRPALHELTGGMIRQALDFYREVNRHRGDPGAGSLPAASEACLTIADNLHCVERRLERLKSVNASSGVHREAASFIRTELSEAWGRAAEIARKQAPKMGLALEQQIAPDDRRLSPADFGFHNTILTTENRLCFFDFEYAGWDDPAKIVCDFFCQPEIQVPMAHYDTVVETAAADLSDPALYRRRIAVLMPLCWLKWCCILLNDFLPVAGARRRFARGPLDQEERYAMQLQKARLALEGMTQRLEPSRAGGLNGIR